MSATNNPNTPPWSLIPSTSKIIKYNTLRWDEPMWPPVSRLDFAHFGEPPFSDTSIAPLVWQVGQSSVYYNFTGTRVVVEATVDNSPNDSSWHMTCRVDGQDFPVALNVWNRQANHLPLCDARDLSPQGVHSLNFTIHIDAIAKISPQVYFDLLKVAPSPSTNLENALVYMQHNASMVAYEGPSWQANDLGHYTSTNGSKVVINFSGTKLLWYGFYDPSLGGSAEESTATFVLDNYPSQPFKIPRISSAPSERQIGLPHLTTVALAPGMHRLEVTYASTTGRPLSLHHLVIQNAPSPSDAPISTPDIPSTQTPTSDQIISHSSEPMHSGGLSKSAMIAIAVNLVVAGLVVIGISVFLWCIRRSKTSRAKTAKPYLSYLRPSLASLQSPDMATKVSSPTLMVAPKRTPAGQVPVQRGSLHITALNEEDCPPPYNHIPLNRA